MVYSQTVSIRKLLGIVVAVTGFVVAASDCGLRADEVKHKRVIHIVKIDVVPGKRSATRNNSTIEVNFSVEPSLPKGATVVFDLRFGFDPDPLDTTRYTLESEKRNGLKLSWKPKKRLPVGEYSIKTYIPLAIQKAVVAREIKKRQKAFPPDSAPWSWYYPDIPIKVGTAADLKAEREEVKKYFRENTASVQEYYYEFVDEMEKLKAGEKYVDGGSLRNKALVDYVEPWMKKYGTLQKQLRGFESLQPGLFSKDRAAYLQLELLSQQAAKCAWEALKVALEKRGTSLGNFKFKGSKDFNANIRGRVRESKLVQTYEAINRLIQFDVETPEGSTEASSAEKSSTAKTKSTSKKSGSKSVRKKK